MATWRGRRKAALVFSTVSAVFVSVLVAVFVIFVVQPERELPPAGEDPFVEWSVAVPVEDDIYSAVAYLTNTDGVLGAPRARYRFEFHDHNGEIVGVRTGETFFSTHESFFVFESNIGFETPPAWVSFRWLDIDWREKGFSEDEHRFSVTEPMLERLGTEPRLEARLINTGPVSLPRTEVFALLSDRHENTVGVSRTTVNPIPFEGSAQLTFTWPRRFLFPERACQPELSVSALHVSAHSSNLESAFIRFENEIVRGFSWRIEESNPETVLEKAVFSAGRLSNERNPLLALFLSSDMPLEIVEGILDEVEDIDFVAVVYDNREGGAIEGADIIQEDVWGNYLEETLDELCLQDPDRIEFPARAIQG